MRNAPLPNRPRRLLRSWTPPLGRSSLKEWSESKTITVNLIIIVLASLSETMRLLSADGILNPQASWVLILSGTINIVLRLLTFEAIRQGWIFRSRFKFFR